MEYADNVTMGIRNFSEIKNNDVQELVPEVEIRKLMSLRYFDNQ